MKLKYLLKELYEVDNLTTIKINGRWYKLNEVPEELLELDTSSLSIGYKSK